MLSGQYTWTAAETIDDESLFDVSLVPWPMLMLLGALITDDIYLVHFDPFWARTSEWLLAAGAAVGIIAVGWSLVRHVGFEGERPSLARCLRYSGNILALVLALLNVGFRWLRGATLGVVPVGVTLSALAVVLLVGTSCLGRANVAALETIEFEED